MRENVSLFVAFLLKRLTQSRKCFEEVIAFPCYTLCLTESEEVERKEKLLI